MWMVQDMLSTIIPFAHTCWAWLPTITATLRFSTAVLCFSIATHRTIRHIRTIRRG